jgi:hypothetical protein
MKKMNKNILSVWLNLLDGTFSDEEIIELPVLTGSMMPLIIPGKKIRIKCFKEPVVSIGDIIVYREGKEITSHRLIAKIPLFKKTYLYQKGDSVRFGCWINKEQVVGVVDSVQDRSDNYISLVTPDMKNEGRDLAIRQLFRTFLDLALILPRRIKRWLVG